MCVPEHMFVHRVHAGAHGDQNRTLNPLALGLSMVLSSHVGAKN